MLILLGVIIGQLIGIGYLLTRIMRAVEGRKR